MENNASLLKQKMTGEDGVTEEEDDVRLDASNMHGAPRYAHVGNKAGIGGARRQQNSIKLKENMGVRKVKKSSSGIASQLAEPAKKSKKGKAPRPPSP